MDFMDGSCLWDSICSSPFGNLLLAKSPPLMGRALGQAMERISAISATSTLRTFLTEVEPVSKNNSSI